MYRTKGIPKEILKLKDNICIDTTDIMSCYVFTQPFYITQYMWDISEELIAYNISPDEIVRAIDYAMVNNKAIDEVNVVGPKLSTYSEKWRSFLADIEDEIKNDNPGEVGTLSPFATAGEISYCEINFVLGLIRKIRQEKDIDYNMNMIRVYRDLVSKSIKLSTLNQTQMSWLIADAMVYILREHNVSTSTTIFVKPAKDAEDLADANKLVDIYMKFIGKMKDEGIVPNNFREKQNAFRFLVGENLLTKCEAYLKNYDRLSLSCKYFIMCAMMCCMYDKVGRMEGVLFVDTNLIHIVQNIFSVKEIKDVEDRRINNLGVMFVAMHYNLN